MTEQRGIFLLQKILSPKDTLTGEEKTTQLDIAQNVLNVKIPEN
jgi:hypothetical protein